MIKNILISTSALLIGVLFLTTGSGLLGTALSIKMEQGGLLVTTAGIVMSFYYIGLTVGSVYNHKIISNVGHIRSFAGFASIASAATLVHGFYLDPYTWSILRFIFGFSVAGLTMCIESWFNSISENNTRGTILSLYMIVFYLGIALGQYLLNIPDFSGFTFYIISSIMLSVSLVPIVLTRVPAPEITTPTILPFEELFKISPIGVMGCVACGLTSSAFYSLGAVFAYHLELSLAQISFFMFATVCGGFLLQWPIGKLSDFLDRRKVLLYTNVVIALIAVAVTFTNKETFPILLWLSIFLGGTIFCVYPVSISHANDYIKKEDSVSASGGLMLAYSSGAIGGPIIASGFMRSFGANGLLWHIALISLLFAGLCVWRIYHIKSTPDDSTNFYALPQYSTQVMTELDPRTDADLTGEVEENEEEEKDSSDSGK